MITLLKAGAYRLIETRKHVKILYLDDDAFAWIIARRIGEILVSVRKQHKTDCTLSIGAYKLYDVEDEPQLTDVQHLELEIGNGKWQGYLLLSGLPSRADPKVRIIPTPELINGVNINTRLGKI